MTSPLPLALDADDPRVLAARTAERQLFDCYRLAPTTYDFILPGHAVRVRVNEFGSGDPVLIVPGNTGDGFPFAPLLAELRGRRVLLLNRPGGGLSEGMDHRAVDFHRFAMDTIDATLDHFGLGRVAIIGHSIGGHWSQWYAMDRPDRVSALALLGVPGNVLTTHPPFTLRLTSVPGLGAWLTDRIIPTSIEKSLNGLAFLGHSKETIATLPPAMAACYLAFPQLPHYTISAVSLMRKVNRLRGSRPEIRITAEQLARIQAPTTFLWGTHDPFGGIETGRHIASLVHTAEFHAIDGGGHLPWLDDPARCGRIIERFFADHGRTAIK
jgi:pimeloyl-ACP methyl ester carboxylesterase